MRELLIVAVSDNHGARRPVQWLQETYQNADYFLHLGDSEGPMRWLNGYACVRGNNDYDPAYPEHRVLKIGEHRVLLTHGHRELYRGGMEGLIYQAGKEQCDIIFYGHTHIYSCVHEKNIWLLNPGSIRRNRDGSNPSYMLVRLNGPDVSVSHMEYNPGLE